MQGYLLVQNNLKKISMINTYINTYLSKSSSSNVVQKIS